MAYIKYTNCPTCGTICKLIPQPPKEPIHLVPMEGYEQQRILESAIKDLNIKELDLRSFLDTIPYDILWRYIIERIKWPNGRPISWSDLYGER